MRLAAYERTGGVRGAVARLAEQAYGRLTERRRSASRAASCCGWPARARATRVVRRRVPLDELELGDDAQAARCSTCWPTVAS